MEALVATLTHPMKTSCVINTVQLIVPENSSSLDSTMMESPEIPKIIPCINGKELDINAELVCSCLSAISIKVLKCRKRGDVRERHDQTAADAIQPRNSFVNLHRPEVARINNAPHSPRKLAMFLHKHATMHGQFCEELHYTTYDNPEEPHETDQIRCLLAPRPSMYADEKLMIDGREGEVMTCFTRQLTDEDLKPGEVVRKSRALFCVLGRNMDAPLQETAELTIKPMLLQSGVNDDNSADTIVKTVQNEYNQLSGAVTDLTKLQHKNVYEQ